MENEGLLLSDDVGEERGEFLGHFALRNQDRELLQHIPICARHLRTVGGCTRLGNKSIAGDARDDDGIMLRETGSDDDGVGGTQAIERGDADLVEVGPYFSK